MKMKKKNIETIQKNNKRNASLWERERKFYLYKIIYAT